MNSSEIFKALGDQSRLRAVAALMDRELCGCQMVELLQLRAATVSRHMGQLVRCGLVTSRKEGRWVIYRLSQSRELAPLLHWLRERVQTEGFWSDDSRTIGEILTQDREELCRRQRGEACCPRGEQK